MARQGLHTGWLGLLSVLLMGLTLAGCEGDDGTQGPQGDQGPPGDPGIPGPPGPSGAVPVTSAEQINVEILSADLSAANELTIVVGLTNDLEQGLKGMPAANIRFTLAQLSPGTGGASSEWAPYIKRDRGGVANAQATTETATAGDYTDNGDGTYTYTFANALPDYPAGPTFDSNKTHRVGVEIRTSSSPLSTSGNIPANNAPTDFVPAVGYPGAAPTFTRLIVDSDTCNACHDNLEEHGDARFDVEYCVTCHNPGSIDPGTGNTVDLKVLVHNIHSGRDDYFVGTHNWADVVWPQDVRNCQTCHDESDADTPQASNWRLVPNRRACGTCHWDDPNNPNNNFAIEDGVHPGGFQFNDDTQCVDCHGPNGTVEGPNGRLVQVPVAHEILEVTLSKNFEYRIIAVRNTAQGQFPEVDYQVVNPQNANTPYNLATDPAFLQCATRESRLSVNIAWSTTDYANIGSGVLPALPVQMNALPACGSTATTADNQTFTLVSTVAVPATATGSLSVSIEGHPAIDPDGDGTFDSEAPVKSAIEYAGITDVTGKDRILAINIVKCDDCHNKLSMHGSNRTDEPEVCVTCHNPMMTDVNRRSSAACLNDTGTSDDTSIDFKRMIHGMHASGTIGVPYVVCGFSGADVYDYVYPGRLNNCEGCHVPGGYYPLEPGERFGTTVDANDRTILTDDRVISPNTAVCSACHVSDLAAQHMTQNGGDFNATKAADGSLVSSGVETCVVCHGQGRTADVKVVHKIDTFQFN
ncbi:MAG: OmcA/MtrC family decaheme c-type cytochrome [Gammaproteobacteria bacterium]|nr:OmcA/MtrC family decaheme c-type cytochrome [Gammaproteobacteria bacterium]MDH4254152.1 OmcA/MtrC family decaheme c-type cytochrome [Gammaproteobacteria bacterium]MDH5309481.1 OmcA/MtrC family decaheme c-type cytochrome [Gammaproteobacteria bacterium]